MFLYHAKIKSVSYQGTQDATMSTDEVLAWAAVEQTEIFAALLAKLEDISSKLDTIDNTISGK